MNAQELIQSWIDAGIVNPMVAENGTIISAMLEGIANVNEAAERDARQQAFEEAAQILDDGDRESFYGMEHAAEQIREFAAQAKGNQEIII